MKQEKKENDDCTVKRKTAKIKEIHVKTEGGGGI